VVQNELPADALIAQHLQLVYVESVGQRRLRPALVAPAWLSPGHVRRPAAVIDDLGAGPIHPYWALPLRRVVRAEESRQVRRQHLALHHADRLVGVVLYDSAPATGPGSGHDFATLRACVGGTYVEAVGADGAPDRSTTGRCSAG
jgi:hypothetical protein